MSNAPALLNDDGTASIATALMMSHHGFRRDLARFAAALTEVARGNTARVEALREEWARFRATLHGHHEAEDQGVLPSIGAEHAELRATTEQLSADHRRIDPLLDRGDAAFAQLPDAAPATALVSELKALLDPHLATEEAKIIPFLRAVAGFPPPPDDATAAMYAEGFAWCMQGVASDVLERVYAMLPESITSKLPEAIAAFAARAERAFGPVPTATTRTPIPAGYA